MSPMLIHENETIVPNHLEFEPERWLQNDRDWSSILSRVGRGLASVLQSNKTFHLAFTMFLQRS